MRALRLVFALFGLAFVQGCLGDQPPDGVATVVAPQAAAKPRQGTWLNGPYLTGTVLAGAWTSGVSVDGGAVSDVALDGSELRGTLDGAAIAGRDFEGAAFEGFTAGGRSVDLTIDAVNAPVAPDDVWTYVVTIEGSEGGEGGDEGANARPLCGLDGNGDAVVAIAVGGRWDPRAGVPGGGAKSDDAGVFTLACRGSGAIAKCIDQGYRPWATRDGVSLDEYHQACVRMLRDDLCGDGGSYTVSGRVIRVGDDVGLWTRDTSLLITLSWTLEAEWTTAGAACVSTDVRNRFLATGRIPWCLLRLTRPLCGAAAHFAGDTRMMNDMRSTDLNLLGLQVYVGLF